MSSRITRFGSSTPQASRIFSHRLDIVPSENVQTLMWLMKVSEGKQTLKNQREKEDTKKTLQIVNLYTHTTNPMHEQSLLHETFPHLILRRAALERIMAVEHDLFFRRSCL